MATFQWLGPALVNQYNGGTAVDWDTDVVAGSGGSIRMGLYTASWTPNPDTHFTVMDVGTANEVSGSGYNVNGTVIPTRSVNIDGGNNRVGLLGGDVLWGTATIASIRYAVVYRFSGTAPTSPLLCYADLGAQSVTAANFTVDITNGTVAYLTY